MFQVLENAVLRRYKKISISLAVIALASAAIFGYREWKTAQIERFCFSVVEWMPEHVFKPNDILVLDVFGGGTNWLGLGKDCNVSFRCRKSGCAITAFVSFRSGPLSVEMKDVLLAIGGVDLPRDPNEIAKLFSNATPRRRVPLEEARTFDAQQWADIAAQDSLGTIRVVIPPEKMPYAEHFYLHEELPGLFGKQTVEGRVPTANEPEVPPE